MITRWGANIEKDKVLLEYPRPQMRRNSYINLNGMWQYAIVRGESLPDKIDGEILVPFSPECLLSGVRRTVSPEDMLWYVKNFSLPADLISAGYCCTLARWIRSPRYTSTASR